MFRFIHRNFSIAHLKFSCTLSDIHFSLSIRRISLGLATNDGYITSTEKRVFIHKDVLVAVLSDTILRDSPVFRFIGIKSAIIQTTAPVARVLPFAKPVLLPMTGHHNYSIHCLQTERRYHNPAFVPGKSRNRQ